MSEDRFDDLLKKAAEDYNAPPEVPREEMWARIEDRRKTIPRWARWQPRWIAWPLAAAATMILVFALLRDVDHRGDIPTFAEAPSEMKHKSEDTARSYPERDDTERDDTDVLYRLAAEGFFARTDAVLTQFRSSKGADESTERISAWAKDLLTETRFLMDSPAARDDELKLLLEDLEFVLAQITQLGPSGQGREREVKERRWIQQGLNNKDLLLRLRRQTPAGQGLPSV